MGPRVLGPTAPACTYIYIHTRAVWALMEGPNMKSNSSLGEQLYMDHVQAYGLHGPMGPMVPWAHGPHGPMDPMGPGGPVGPMGPMGPWAL